MGFFSSRRHDSDAISNSPSAQSHNSSSSTAIIRSRFVRMNDAHVLPSCILMSRHSSAFAVWQYGRNKGKAKAREASSTPSRGVTTSPPAPAESRKEPSVNDTLTPRTTDGHRALNDIETRGVSEPSLHSPVSQKAPKSPALSNNTRASTDAITHVSLSQSHASTDTFLRIMLSQRLAELASANAEGLLEYVVLMKQISDLGD